MSQNIMLNLEYQCVFSHLCECGDKKREKWEVKNNTEKAWVNKNQSMVIWIFTCVCVCMLLAVLGGNCSAVLYEQSSAVGWSALLPDINAPTWGTLSIVSVQILYGGVCANI